MPINPATNERVSKKTVETPKKFILIFRVMSSKITVSSAGGNSMSEITKVALDVMG